MASRKGQVALQVYAGRDLAVADVGGSSDPFVVVGLMDAKKQALDPALPQFRTPVVKKSLNPKFQNQLYEFNPVHGGVTRTVLVQVFDEDLMSDDYLGYFTIDLEELPDGKVIDQWFKLKPRNKKDTTVSGEIRVSVVYKRYDNKIETKPPAAASSSSAPAGKAGPAASPRKKGALDIEQTNIANLGSDLEKKVRLEAAKKEVAWAVAGQKPGLEIWRIEKFNVVSWPKSEFGKFFSGDSYIVLNTYKKSPDSDALAWDIHFWLGEFTTADEAGTAAYKTVELDDFLGGAPVQHREVQSYESELFLSYFNGAIIILQGGIETGFKHVGAEEYKPRLLEIKGKKNVRCIQIPLSGKMLNSGDVFILDDGLHIFQWQGKSAGVGERIKAAQIARSIAADRKGLPQVIVLDEASGDTNEQFWKVLGGKCDVHTASEGGDDTAFEAATEKTRYLFRLSDESGTLQFEEVAHGRITRNMLSSNDAFIFDTGAHIYAWIGSKASVAEKQKSMQYAQEYVTKYNRPVYLPLTRMLDGSSNRFF